MFAELVVSLIKYFAYVNKYSCEYCEYFAFRVSRELLRAMIVFVFLRKKIYMSCLCAFSFSVMSICVDDFYVEIFCSLT